MADVYLGAILDEVCDWCPFAYCHDDCGVKAIAQNYNTETTITTVKEVRTNVSNLSQVE